MRLFQVPEFLLQSHCGMQVSEPEGFRQAEAGSAVQNNPLGCRQINQMPHAYKYRLHPAAGAKHQTYYLATIEEG
jgi:hypothetical protein